MEDLLPTSVESAQAVEDTKPPVPPPENRIFYPALDGLRAFAALLVFCQHYLVASTPPALEWGWIGVDIFFVLSGFLITGILFDTVDAPHRFRNFYVRRTLRIFPLYYGVLALVLFSTPLFHWNWNRLWLLWPAYLGNYAPAIGDYLRSGNVDVIHYLTSKTTGLTLHFIHFWSLSVEEQFYLVWPLVVYQLRDRLRLQKVCLAVILLLPLLRVAARIYLPGNLTDSSILRWAMPFRIDGFLIGGLAALLLRGEHGKRVRASGARVLLVSLVALMGVWTFAAKVLHQGLSANANRPWMSTVGYTLVDLASVGLLLLTLRPGTLAYRVFSIKPLRRIGQVSYGFYVFHDIPMEIYQGVVRRLVGTHIAHIGFLVFPLALVCTTSLAFLSFRYLETPFLRLKDRFTV